jgi:hypothetical protein
MWQLRLTIRLLTESFPLQWGVVYSVRLEHLLRGARKVTSFKPGNNRTSVEMLGSDELGKERWRDWVEPVS